MATNSDVGHTRNLANFYEIIQKGIGLGQKYDPSNTSLKTGKMNAQYNECKAAQDDLTVQEAIYDPIQNARVLKFAPLNKLSTRCLNMLIGCGANDEIIHAARSSVRKIRGDHAKPKAKAATTEGEGDTGAETGSTNGTVVSISNSQQSFVMRAKNFGEFIQTLKNEPLYKPNEPDLKVASLTAYLDDLTTSNNEAAAKIPAVENARAKRNTLFYEEGTGMVDVATDCKKYIKGAFGATSQEFKTFSGIQFTHPVSV